jgi:hypothetical protein
MAIDVNPTGVFASYEYSSNGTTGLSSTDEGIYIPLSDIPQLDSSEADQALGTADYRKIIWGMLDATVEHHEGLDSADVPANMAISRGSLSFLDEDTAQRSYTVTFRYSVPQIDVEGE